MDRPRAIEDVRWASAAIFQRGLIADMANQRRIKMLRTKRNVQPPRLHFELLESRRLLAGINVSIYLDQNQNGIFDPAGDVPAANRIVYVDLNDNGRFDQGEPLAFSNEQGWVAFDGLEQGDYRVRILADESYQRIIDPFGFDPSTTPIFGAGSRWVIESVDGVWGLSPSGTLTFLDAIGPGQIIERLLETHSLTTLELGGQPTSLLQLSESEAWIVYQTNTETRLAIFDSVETNIDHFVLATDGSYRIDQLAGSSTSGVYALTESFAGKQVQKLTRDGQQIVTQDLLVGSLEYIAFLEGHQVLVGARVQETHSVVEMFSPTGDLIDTAIVPGFVEALVSDPISSRFSVATDVTTHVFGVTEDSLIKLAILAESAAPIAMHGNRFVAADRGRLGQITIWNSRHWAPVNQFVLPDAPALDLALFNQGDRLVSLTEDSIYLAEIRSTANDQSVLVTTLRDGDVSVRFGVQLTGQVPPLNFDSLNTRLAAQNTSDIVDLRAMLSQYSSSQLWFELSSQPANGFVNLSPTGQLTYTPNTGFTGLEPVVLTVYDGVQRAELTVLWQVTSTAQPPLEILVEVAAFSEGTPVGSQLGYVTVVSPNPGDAFRVSTSDPRFRVEHGRLYLEEPIDFELEPTIELELVAVDEQSQFSMSKVIVLEVLNVAEAPSGIILIGNTVDESASNVLVGRLVVQDPDAEGDYEITVNDPRFTVINDQLWLTESLTYDVASEVHLTVTASDRHQPELFAVSNIVISVLPKVEIYPELQLSNLKVPESTLGAIVGSLIVKGLGDETLSYTVSDSRFEVVDGVLRLSEGSALNRHAESTIVISITVSNVSGVSATVIFPLTVIPPLSPWQNPNNHADVNGDGRVSAIDVLMVINHLNQYGSGPAQFPPGNGGQDGNAGGTGEPPAYFPDVNGDGRITPLDALLIINELNAAANSDPSNPNDGEGTPNDGEGTPSDGEGSLSHDEGSSSEADSSDGPLQPEGEAVPKIFDSQVLAPMLMDDWEFKRRENARLDAELEALLEQLARQRVL